MRGSMTQQPAIRGIAVSPELEARVNAELARAQATNAQAQAARLQQQAQAAKADADAALAKFEQDAQLSSQKGQAVLDLRDQISQQVSGHLEEQGVYQQLQRAVENGGHHVIRLAGGGEIAIDDGRVDLENLFSHTGDTDDIPRQAMQTGVEMLSIVAVAIVAIVVGLPLARAFARWLDRRTAVPHVPAEVASRLSNIENAVESVAIEVERISEGQRFTSKLLADRAQPVPVGERL